LDWSNPNVAASQLAEIGVTDPAQIATLFNLYKNNEELGLSREKNLFERERLGNERQRLGLESAGLGLRGQELGLKAQEHMLKIQELQQRLSGNPSPEQAAKIESDLRKEFTALKSTQNFEVVKSAYENIKEGYKEDNPAANLNMVYSFVHLLDPSSTVGPGEKISVENSRGLSEGMVAKLNLLLGTGGYLGEKQRKDILHEAHKIYKNSNKTHKEKATYYKGLAGKYKVQPENIIGAKPEEVEEIPAALNTEENIIRQLKAAGLSDEEIANIGR
jgi:ribosomal protein L20A (L18A)